MDETKLSSTSSIDVGNVWEFIRTLCSTADLEAPSSISAFEIPLRSFIISSEPSAIFLISSISSSTSSSTATATPIPTPSLSPRFKPCDIRVAVGREQISSFAQQQQQSIPIPIPIPRLVLIKTSSPIDLSRSLSSQISILTLPEGIPALDSLHSIIRAGVTPLFGCFAFSDSPISSNSSATSNKQQQQARPGIELVQQKIAELDIALGSCKSIVRIDRIDFEFHNEISLAAQNATRPLRVDDLSNRLEDPTFSNAVQSCVNKWISQLRKLTSLKFVFVFPDIFFFLFRF